ncbi:MAG TPA: hypothetical protein VNY81_05475 [Candidatus Saccharimonadales bacterium]|nr:hypothetical protein [Candidatus Saccharimonadales bacterium]
MKTRISLNRLWLGVVALTTVCASAPLWASSAFHGQILMEYVGQVVNGTPTPASSNQFGNLHGVAGVDPSLQFTFYTEATTVKAVANGPLRIVGRMGTTTIYLAYTPGDFSNPDSFRSGTPVQVSTLRQQVIVDTSTGAFTVVNINTITTATEFLSDGDEIQLGKAGQSFRTVLNGHLNAPGMLPTGWFGGYAVTDTD